MKPNTRTTLEFVDDCIDSILQRPGMWGSNLETLEFQLFTLLQVRVSLTMDPKHVDCVSELARENQEEAGYKTAHWLSGSQGMTEGKMIPILATLVERVRSLKD